MGGFGGGMYRARPGPGRLREAAVRRTEWGYTVTAHPETCHVLKCPLALPVVGAGG